jgi:hypothetical protein
MGAIVEPQDTPKWPMVSVKKSHRGCSERGRQMTKVESFSGLAAVACLKIFFDSFKSGEVLVMNGFFLKSG